MKTFLLVAIAAITASGAPPLLTQTPVFESGSGGYKLYRIPGVVVTKAGTILVYCEGRRKTGGDWDTIDLLLSRSTDKGATFSAPMVVGRIDGPVTRNPVAIERRQGSAEDVTYNNPVAIADHNGTVHMLFCVEYMRVFHMVSRDDGRTFSKPVEITHALDSLKPGYAWRVVATGPGHGIQLRNGRLIVPAWVALGTEGNGHAPSANTTIFSDDHGKTWRVAGLAMASSQEFPNPNESAAVELSDGRVLLNVRVPSKENQRVVTLSADGASGWSAPRYVHELPDPICMAGLVRWPGKGILFSNPDNLTRADEKDLVSKDRKNLTVRLSRDEGQTWQLKRVLESGAAGYSDLAVLPDGTVVCFYETAGRMMMARFNWEWLEGRQTP